MTKVKAVQWKAVEVAIDKIKPTPNNFKLKTEEGLSRFQTSVTAYGLAGSVILNADFTLIDGNTRVDKAKEMGMKKVWASMPDRKLTPKEFTEFAAMYDMARAGEVDVLRIKEELGTTESFFKKWGFELPEVALKNLAELEKKEAVINPTSARTITEAEKAIQTRPITLLFTVPEAAEYLELCEQLYAPLKVNNVTDATLAVTRIAAKAGKKYKADNFTDIAKLVIKDIHKDVTKPKAKKK